MKNLTFHGIDANNEISLLGYGILLSDQKHEDNSGTQFCIYKQGNEYGSGHYKEEEINNLLEGKEWASKEDISSFLSYVGYDNLKDYINTPFVVKLSDLASFFGTENIFGTDYFPMNEEEVKERYLK